MNEITQLGTVAVLNIVGFLIKQTPAIPNRWIPHILVLCGAISESAKVGLSFDSVLAGALKGVEAVGAHQLFSAFTRPADPAHPAPPAALVSTTP